MVVVLAWLLSMMLSIFTIIVAAVLAGARYLLSLLVV
jgi:hypothetical protein